MRLQIFVLAAAIKIPHVPELIASKVAGKYG